MAIILGCTGDLYTTQRRFPEAERAYTEALTIFRETSTSALEPPAMLCRLGALYSIEGRRREAKAMLDQAWKIVQTAGASTAQREVASGIRDSLGIVAFNQRQFSKAESLFAESLELASEAGGLNLEMGQVLSNLGLIYEIRKQFDKAEQAYRRSLEITESLLSTDHPEAAMVRENLGGLYMKMHRFEEAQEQFLRSLAVTEATDPIVENRVFRLLHLLGQAYLGAGKNAEAEQTIERAVRIARRNPRVDEHSPEVMEMYSGILRTLGRLQESQAIHAEAKKMRAEVALTLRIQN